MSDPVTGPSLLGSLPVSAADTGISGTPAGPDECVHGKSGGRWHESVLPEQWRSDNAMHGSKFRTLDCGAS